jgi:hypothetical protein
MAVSTKGKKYLGKVSMPVKAEKGMEVKPISEMDYSERKEYIQENYLPNILEAQKTFNFYNTGFSYDFDDKDAQKEILEYYQGESDYTEKELSEKTNYRLNGWDIVRVDTDEETNEEYEEELEELISDNTYNGSYLGLVDLNWRAYYDEMYDKYFYVIHPHLGGDIRGNYGEAFILEGDSKDDLFYRFYEGFVSGSLNVYIKLKDALPVKDKNKPSVLLFDSQQDSDVALFEFYEDGSEINSKIAQQLLNDFESFSGWEGDEFIDEIVDEYNRVKKAKKYMGGGYLDESPKIYVDILGTDTGKWMDLDGMTEGYEVMDAIQEFIDEYNESKGGNAEEYRIADMEGFGQSYFYNEYMGESDFDTLLNSYSAYQDSDYPAELIFEYANDNNLDIEDAIRSMEDNYYGAYDNMSDFAYQMVSEGLYNPSGSDVYVTDTDKRLISGEEADSRIDNMNNREIIESSSQGELIYTNKYSEIEDKISELKDEISSLEDLQSENENDEDYDNIAETITDKESEIEELEEELENLEEEIADEVRQEVYDNFYDETYDRLENDLEDWLSEFGYEDYTDVNFLVIDYDSISDDLAQDYSVYEADNKYYLFINYKGGGTIKSVGQPKDYSYYIVEKDYNKIISGHNSKKEALKEKSKLKKEHKYLNMDVYSRKVLDVDMDIDTTSFNSFAKPETFKYGGKIALRSGIKATDEELWKSSNDLKNRLTKSRAGIDEISLDEQKNIKRNLSRVRAKNYLKHKTFNLGGMPETNFLPPDKTPEERRIIHNQRLLTASRSIGNVKESVGGAKDWVQKQWEEADFGDGKGRAKFELGGYIKGDEVLFKNNGKISKGTITDELGNGEYAIFSGSGFGLSQSLVNERDIEGYAPAYEKRKFFGMFNDGGQLRRYDSVVYFKQMDDDEEYSKEYLHIHANTEEQAEKIARERFFQEDAQRYFSPFINYVSLWDRGMIENKSLDVLNALKNKNPEERKGAMQSMKGFDSGGSIENQNKAMLENDAVQIEHHSEELNEVVPKTKKVPAWVIGKTSRINSDLSDVTHYLDGKSQVKKKFKKFNTGGTLDLSREKAHKVFHLPYESAVYVPSTSNVDEVISASEMEARVEEVQNYLGNLFGGFSSAETMGGFVDSQGKLVNEDIIKVTSFAEKDAFNQNKEDLLNKLAHWSKDWGQEAMGFEFEGDLYYVPANYKKGGQLKPIPQGNKGLPKLPEKVRNRMGYMDNGGFISDYFYYEPIQFNEGGGVGELQVGDVITFMEDEQKVIRPIKEIKDDGILVIQLSKDEYIEINPELVIEVKRKQTPYEIITKKIGLPDFVAEYLVQRNKKYAVWLADSIKKQELETTDFVLGWESGALQNETIFINDYREKITSIIDWLEFPLTPNQNLNEMSFQFAYDESVRWHNQLEAKGGDINYVEPTENKIIKEYPTNEQGVEYYWTLIPSSFCQLESDRMGHCGRTRHEALISLRSKTPLKQGYISDSHVTVAFGSDGLFYQVKGKKNQKPAEKYFPFIYDLIITLIDAEKDGEAELRRRIDEEQAEQIKNYNAKLKEYEDSISNSTKAIDKLEKELENNFDSLDVDEYEQKLEEIELLKNVDSPVRRKLRELDNSHQLKLQQIEDKHLNSRLQFNGFGTEYQSSQDYGFSEMTRNQKVQLFKLKPNVLENVEDMIEFYVEGLITKEEILSKIKDNEDFDKYKIQIKLYDAGLIEQLPNTLIEIEYDANDLSRFFKSDYSDETIYQMITGEDTYSWFDGSWSYYYENATDYIDELNKENQQIIIDYMIENSDLTQEQIQEEGIKYYLNDDDYSEDFDEVKRSLASSLTSSEEGAMLKYYYSKIKEALEELGEVVSLNDEGLKMKVELTNFMNEEEISEYEESFKYGDFEEIFKEALYRHIDLPILRIDDRYSDRADLNEYFYGVE